MLTQSPYIIKYRKLFLSALVFIFLIFIFFHSDSAVTQDLGRHLKLGEIILQQKRIPSTNLFSYTYPSFPFINHHWASEVIFYLINREFGINSLVVIKILILLASFGVIYYFALSRVNFFYLFLSSILSLEILRERTAIRPEVFAYLLLVAFLVVVYRERNKRGRSIYILPVLILLWVNLHISFIFGLVIFLFFLIDRFLLEKLTQKYLIIGASLLLFSLINPFGFQGATYPLQIFSNYGYSIVENQSPIFLEKFFTNPTIIYFKIAIFITIIAIPFLLSKKLFLETFTLLSFGILSFSAIRHFPFFSLVFIYPLSLGLTIIEEKIFIISSKFKKNQARIKLGIVVILVIFLLIEIYALLSNSYYLRHKSHIRSGFGQTKGIEDTVNYFIDHKLKGPIFNNFDIGSYLIYRLYPNEKVFVDSRPEAYSAAFFQNEYIPMQQDEKIWQEVEKKYKFKTIIFGHTDATSWAKLFLARITKDQHWKIVYFDDYGVILVQKDSMSDNISLDNIERLKNYAIRRISRASKNDELIRLANFFDQLGLTDLSNMARIKERGM